MSEVISRRDFLRLNKPNTIGEKAPAHEARSEVINLPNNTTVLPVGVWHTPSYYEEHKEELQNLIKSHEFVALEADPTEESPAQTSFREFFKNIIKDCWDGRKPILYVDPQNSIQSSVDQLSSYLLISGVPFLPGVVGEALKSKKVSRRTAIKGLVSTLTTIGFLNTELGNGVAQFLTKKAIIPTNPLSYHDFRNAGAILGLRTAAKLEFVKGNGIYIVGGGHVERYVYFSQHPEETERAYRDNFNRYISEFIGESPHILLLNPRLSEPGGYQVDRSIPLLPEKE